MSLLNDALKRAENARAEAFPSMPQLHPVTLAREAQKRRAGWFLPALIVAVLMLAGFFLWQWYVDTTLVKARTRPMPAIEEIKPKPEPAVPAPKPTQPVAAVPEKPVQTSNSLTASLSTAMTNLIAAVTTGKGSAFKLQTIFFRAKSPSAVINGETVFIGDRIGGAKVTAIEKNSATIEMADGQTQQLELP